MQDPAAKASRALVRRCCLDVLQRTPSDAEMRVYLGAPVDAIVPRLLGSQEAMEVWLEEELYYFLLIDNFRPQTPALTALPARLRGGEVGALEAIGEIVRSTSFSLRNPGNDTFVTVVMEQCLGVPVQEQRWARELAAGKKMYDGQRARFLGESGSSQADLVRIALAHELAARHLLDRHHRRLFGAPLPGRETGAALVARMQSERGGFFALLGEWLASADYAAALAQLKLRSDRQFIRSLYMDLLERTPSYEEMRNMRNALLSMADSRPLRAVLAKVILDSRQARLPALEQGAAADFVARCFERYLGRAPAQSEATEFTTALQQDGATPALVVRALVGSPEYQHY
jgi:hypothetical protein